jgi:hypothetical protein
MGQELTDAEKEQLLAIFYLDKIDVPALDHLTLRIAESMSDGKQKSRSLLALVNRFISHGNIALADQIARQHLARYYQAAALAELGTALANNDPAASEDYLTQSEEILDRTDDQDEKQALLDVVARGRSRLRHWVKAIKLAARISLPCDRVFTLCRIYEDMCSSGMGPNSEQLLASTRAAIDQTDPTDRCLALDDLARAMLNTGQPSRATQTWEEAFEFARYAPDPSEALYLISKGLAMAGQKPRAREVAMAITNEARRAAVLALIETA